MAKGFVTQKTPKVLGYGLAVVIASFGLAHSAAAFTTVPEVTSIEQVATNRPIPHVVTWEMSGQAEDGTKTMSHIEVTVTDAGDDSPVCVLDAVAASATSVTLNKSNCPELHVYGYYSVAVVEVYTDETTSSAGTENFRTKPPTPKNLRTKNREANSVRLRFDRGVQIAGTYIYIDYKVARRSNRANIVENGSVYSDDNFVEVDDLPAGTKLQARVRFRSSSYGNSPWSPWKKFSTPTEE